MDQQILDDFLKGPDELLKIAKLMPDDYLQAAREFSRRQLELIDGEIARRKQEQSQEEGGFAA